MLERPPLPGPRRLGRYALYGEIAAGGMAVVCFGRLLGPAGFSRAVAIKQLHAHLARDAGFRAMFLDEARLAARVRHPNVVPILDVVDEADQLYLVMEYVHGQSFDRLIKSALRRGDGVPAPIAVAVVRDVLHGLHAAHEAKSERGKPLGIVHRDVSPHNVLVGADGVGRVHDFGVAKAHARMQLTSEGQLKGKLAYMAPEQVEQLGVDRRADVWSAAVVLWEALTGKRLFTGDHPAQLMKCVLGLSIPPPRRLQPSIPEALEAIVMRGLERDREQRWSSAHDMAVALDGIELAAAQHAVAEWVQLTAADTLQGRAATLAEIEGSITRTGLETPMLAAGSEPEEPNDAATLVATSLTNAETHALTRPSAASSRALPRWLAFAGVALLAAAGGASVTLWLGDDAIATREPARSSPQASAIAPRVEPKPPPAVASLAALPSAVPAPAPALSKAPSKPARRALPIAKPGAPAKKPHCEVPYTLDEDGVRVPKLDCL